MIFSSLEPLTIGIIREEPLNSPIYVANRIRINIEEDTIHIEIVSKIPLELQAKYGLVKPFKKDIFFELWQVKKIKIFKTGAWIEI